MKKLITSVLVAAGVLDAPIAAAGEPSVTVSSSGARVVAVNEFGQSTAAIAGGTALSLKASGFQAINKGRGGVYVVFGWVDSPISVDWAPSNGGKTGATYLYAPDSEDKDNKGMSKYVAFEGSSTASAANGGLIAADGTWATELVVPAAQFEAMDREGNATTIDCLKVTCGVITIGAHNVTNPNNETFTPISFVDDIAVAEAEVAPQETETPEPSQSTSATETTPSPSADQTESAKPVEDEPEDGSNLLVTSVAFLAVAAVLAGMVLAVRKKK